jgi:predicted permease
LPFDREFVTSIVMNVGVPCLILQGANSLEADTIVISTLLSFATLPLLLLLAPAGLNPQRKNATVFMPLQYHSAHT